jgi:uncharacterized protein YjbI with pentapeptide repeats
MSDSEKPKNWRERRRSIKHKWLIPFIFPEWLCEQLSYFLGRWAFLDILGHIGRLTILIAVITYFMGADERRMQAENQQKARQYQAWQVINIAQGKKGSGGRKDALEDLNNDGVSLADIDISKAYLPELKLDEATLYGANLAEADLLEANLTKANLMDANLAGADLAGANLAGANLKDTNLTEANLYYANLAGANLKDVNLTGVRLCGANLAGANLLGANLAYILDWDKIRSIKSANIFGVNNPPDGFITWAKEQGAISNSVVGIIREQYQKYLYIREKIEQKERKKTKIR